MRPPLRVLALGLLLVGIVGRSSAAPGAGPYQDPTGGATADGATDEAPDPRPRVRTRLELPDPFYVGQRATLVVELLAPGIFAGAASWDLPDPAGVLVLPPGGHPVVSSETIDGESFTVQRHELGVYPVRPGSATVPAFEVRFRHKRSPLDEEALAVRRTTEPADLTAAAPPGAEGLGLVLAARDLTVREAWDPEPGDAPMPAGSALRRTVTFSAPDLPGMLFPPFPTPDVDGLGTYVEHVVDDREDRGERTGQRRDVLTYVCRRPGTVELPAARFTWYDLDAQALRTETLAARTVTVVPNPDLAAAGTDDGAASPGGGGGGARTLAGLVGALVALGLVWRVRRPVGRLARALVGPLRPVHLEPLAPGERSRSARRP